MKYFEKYFSDVNFDGAEETKVLCPFHSDTHPSASINKEKNLFHCWVCSVGYTEQQFIAKVNNISLSDADKVLDKFRENQSQADWFLTEKASLWANTAFLQRVFDLGLSKNTVDNMHLGLVKDKENRLYLGVPVIYNSVIMDVRRYNLLKIAGSPKMMSQDGAKSGFVIPYDNWKTSTTTTYVFEGEKDMLLARELGINAITLTGGAGASPNAFVINAFKDRKVVICYDNDEAGKEGMNHLYLKLKGIAKEIKYVDIGTVVTENKEDFWDFIIKYKGDVIDFYDIEEQEFKNVEDVKKVQTAIKTALTKNYIKKDLLTEITVSASFEDTYAVPQHVVLEKTVENEKKKNETLMVGESKSWYLDEVNVHQMLELIEIDAKKVQLLAKFKQYMGIPTTETGLKLTISDYATVYKVKIMDKTSKSVETDNTSVLDLYTFQPILVGKQYLITYKIYPHPTKNQKIVGIATDIQDLEDMKDFTPNPELLKVFQQNKMTVEEILNKQYQSAKHYIAKHLDYNLWLTEDLIFNSILRFDYGDRIKGALDICIIGDTQVGKSETAQKLTELYDFGHFLSLKTSTTIGLIGGSNKVDGSWLNTIGAIPRQNGKLVVLEEFSGAKPDFIRTMTDIRSSGYLNLARAAGELRVPCLLRMLTISNPIEGVDGQPRHLSTFPNGIIPIMELIHSAEDVARYDGFFLIGKPKTRRNPFGFNLEGKPIPKENYEHKIQWIYTRQPEHVIFPNEVASYIWEKAEELNNLFECNFPLFGTTTSLKLARYCVALSAMLVSTDDNFEKVIVTKDIVDYIVKYLISIYDNPVFKLKEYKQEYESYNMITDFDVAQIQKIYDKNATMFDFLEHQSGTSRGNLRSVSGLEGDKFNPIFNALVKLKLIRISGESVYPTEKFRLAMTRVKRNFRQDVGDSLIEQFEKGDDKE